MLITDRFSSVGQNVAATWTFDKPSPTGEEPEFKRQIEAWFNEVTQIGFRPKDIDPFNFNRQAGHYSQVRPRRQHPKCIHFTLHITGIMYRNEGNLIVYIR